MICKKYKCIFVHIPKTAGQSIEYFFLKLANLTWETRAPLLLRYNPDPLLGPESLAHLTASEYIDCGHITPNVFNSYYKFSFVRNPWDRLVSEYKYREHSKNYSFKKFLFKHLPEPGPSDDYRHIIPQYDFLFDPNGNQLVDFIGKFEKLQEDFDIVCQILGIKESKLLHINQSKLSSHRFIYYKKLFSLLNRNISNKKNYTDFYDNDSLEFVSRMYEKDIKTFAYTFGD